MCVLCLLNLIQHWGSNNCNRIRYASWSIISYNFCISQGQQLWFMDGKCTQHMENTYCLSLLCRYCLLEKYWLWKNITLFNIIVPAEGLSVSHCTLTFDFNHMCPICVSICVELNALYMSSPSVNSVGLCLLSISIQVVIIPFV